MAKRILVTGATGNQGGSVAKLLLQYPDKYKVRVLTRNPESDAAKRLAQQGAEVVKGDLTDASTLDAAFSDCWGAFVVTNFYDATIKDDPASEEQQGRNATLAAQRAGGKHRVDRFIRDEINFDAAVFVYTGNFYENMVLRGHVVKTDDGKGIEFRQPIIQQDTTLHMVWVEKDLSGITKAIFDNWDERKEQLRYQHLYAMDAVHTPREICEVIQRVTGLPTKYVVLPTTGNAQRDIMFTLYNKTGTYPGVVLPDQKVLDLGVQLHGLEQFVNERLVPHLGLG
ncbi:uncharacterized protein Z519_09775 [Cladophialophora bantiana CBS 173.52]|uniref:NmrA-like domain-containing protein n=1 Tax=Cladophialophora bantiana (strain ATCC 10958 / CBS 173.52 / CDC B-1940 / NIH 8579) TaxID=1442370 RepID=A0A0D2HYG0_CLAB1|nr:uncharacterized protein Z519_09775 [Cladophialophora bantiana CBS 173.52]KIW89619.1 hypothetical protein Z519_09775 [Cladophialophora bantiana CBS 173.52]